MQEKKRSSSFKWIIAIAGLGFLMLAVIYSTLPEINEQINDVNRIATVMPGYGRLDVPDALALCRQKQPADKDFCLYNMVEMKRREYDFGDGEVCLEISSTNYRDNCHLLLYQCDKISDISTRNLCQSFKQINKK